MVGERWRHHVGLIGRVAGAGAHEAISFSAGRTVVEQSAVRAFPHWRVLFPGDDFAARLRHRRLEVPFYL
jgi:hypothetical protein